MTALSLVLDGVIMLLLAGTIFYCVRLSNYLKAFRDSRRDLEKLIGDLSGQIERADRAIEGLRKNARDTGRDLQSQINEAKGLSEELQIMSESGNSLAGRLEKLAEKSSRAAPPPSPRKRGGDYGDYNESPPRSIQKNPPPFTGGQGGSLSAFAIRDREYDEEPDAMNEQGLMHGDHEENPEEERFSSRAERELYEALRRKKTEAGGVL